MVRQTFKNFANFGLFAKVFLTITFQLFNLQKFIQPKFSDFFKLLPYPQKLLKKHFWVEIHYSFCIFPSILNKSRNVDGDSHKSILTYLILNEEWETIFFEDWAESTIWKQELGQKQKQKNKKSIMTIWSLPALKPFKR